MSPPPWKDPHHTHQSRGNRPTAVKYATKIVTILHEIFFYIKDMLNTTIWALEGQPPWTNAAHNHSNHCHYYCVKSRLSRSLYSIFCHLTLATNYQEYTLEQAEYQNQPREIQSEEESAMATEDQDRQVKVDQLIKSLLICCFEPSIQLSEDNALKSLAVAECLIDKESLDIIKLSMHNEISEDFRENTKSLSQLYNHLKSRYNNDPTKTIVRLIFALEILGHMRYGYRAANVLKKLFKDDPPALDMSPAMKEDFLFQQLLAIACKLLPSNCYKKFIRYCAKQMRHNQRLYRTPCEVIRVLISTTTLTKDNCSEFMEDALIKAGLSESKLQMYSNQCSKSKQNLSQP